MPPRCGRSPHAGVWGIAGYEALNRIVEELERVADPIRLVRAGLYADIGEEIL